MKKVFRKEVVIGLIVIISMAVLFFGINFLKGINVFKAANYYYVSFTDVQGLALSAPVTVNGFKVGQVREIEYEYDNPGHVLVELALDRNLKVPSGSKAILATDLLGTATIALEMSDSKDFHTVGDHLEGVVPLGMMDKVSNDLLPSVDRAVPKIDSLLTNLNTLVGSPKVSSSLDNVEEITKNLASTTEKINALMASFPPIASNIRHISDNFGKASDDISGFTSELKDIPLDSLTNSLNDILNNIDALTRELNALLDNKDSTIGKLGNDPALYDNINSTISSLDSLFVDIKKNPKRYINIKLL